MNNTKKSKVFISGKVSGEDYQKCFDKFRITEDILNNGGYDVINPLTIVPQGTSWTDAMDIIRPHLINSDIVLFLPDWKNSRGACVEREWAKHYNKKIVEYANLYGKLLKPVKDAS